MFHFAGICAVELTEQKGHSAAWPCDELRVFCCIYSAGQVVYHFIGCGVCCVDVCFLVYLWRSEANPWELVFTLCRVVLSGESQVVRFDINLLFC